MAIPVQVKGVGLTSTASAPTAAFNSNVAVGDIIVITFNINGCVNNPTPTISSLSGLCTDWAVKATQSQGSGITGARSEIWAGTCSTAGTTVTINVSGQTGTSNVSINARMAEYAGYNINTDGSVTNSGSGTTASTGNLTTHFSNDLLVACVASAVGTTPTTPTNSFTSESAGVKASTGSGNDASGPSAGGLSDITETSTGTYSTGWTVANGNWSMALVAFTAASLPQPFFHRGRKVATPRVRAKRPIKESRVLFSPYPFPSAFITTHHAQRHRIPRVKAKPAVRNRWLIERQVTAPHADLPLSARHQRGQPRRIPRIKAKRVVRSSIELRIPPAPPPILPPALRHQVQKKRVPWIKAKRRVLSSIQLRIPASPPPIFPPALRHQGQRRRIPKIKAKRWVLSSIELRIPQAPTATLPLSVRWGRSQARRVAHVKAKRHTLSNLQLRIPQAPLIQPPLPIEARRAQRHRIPRVHRKWVVRSSVELRIVPPPPPLSLIPPPMMRHAQQRKRLWGRVRPAQQMVPLGGQSSIGGPSLTAQSIASGQFSTHRGLSAAVPIIGASITPSFAIPSGVPNSLVVVNATMNILLPPAIGSGDWVVVVRAYAGSNNVAVGFQHGTDTINGVNSPDTLTTQWQAGRYADYATGKWLKW